MTQGKFIEKMGQLEKDAQLLAEGKLNRVIWFGTEPLPSTGLGGQLKMELAKKNIEYWWVPVK